MRFTGVHVQLENMVAVNEEALKQAVEGLTCMQPGNMQAPKDAYVGITDDGYAVIPEEEGTTLDEEKSNSRTSSGSDERGDNL